MSLLAGPGRPRSAKGCGTVALKKGGGLTCSPRAYIRRDAMRLLHPPHHSCCSSPTRNTAAEEALLGTTRARDVVAGRSATGFVGMGAWCRDQAPVHFVRGSSDRAWCAHVASNSSCTLVPFPALDRLEQPSTAFRRQGGVSGHRRLATAGWPLAAGWSSRKTAVSNPESFDFGRRARVTGSGERGAECDRRWRPIVARAP